VVFNNSQDLDEFIEKDCSQQTTNDALALDADDPQGGTTLYNCLYSPKVMQTIRNRRNDDFSFAQPSLAEIQSSKYLLTTHEGRRFLEVRNKYYAQKNVKKQEIIVLKKQKEFEYLEQTITHNEIVLNVLNNQKSTISEELFNLQETNI